MNKMIKTTYSVKGMSCSGCEMKIERILGKLKGVRSVKASFSNNSVTVDYDSVIADVQSMVLALEKAGYSLEIKNGKINGSETKETEKKRTFSINQLIGVGIILFAVYFVISRTIGFNFIPEITPSMGYGVLFLVGLLTSLHCVAMCGGINMSQCISANSMNGGAAAKMKPSILYNLGRVISYTVIGGIVGALGSVISFSGWARGIVAVLSGLFMVIMGLSMLNIFPWLNKITPRMPRFLRTKAGQAGRGKGPFIVGLLNGLMPCGPLQAMQLYALGTGSVLTGALSMFLFSLGTVPLMFGLGALSSLLSAKFTSKMISVSAAMVLVLGLVMVNRGMALSGVNLMPDGNAKPQTTASASVGDNGNTVTNGVQNITSKLTSSGYPVITVQKGIPVRWTIQVDAKDLNGCNRTLIIPKFNQKVTLKAGDNIIEFTPKDEGTIPYSCWMGMIKSKIMVVAATTGSVDDQQGLVESAVVESVADTAAPDLTGSGGCCASAALAPEFANGKIPVDEVTVAKIVDGVQEVTITVNDQGYSPAVAVVQKGIKTKIKFVAEKLNQCNSSLYFPDLNGELSLSAGELETPILTPVKDFTFECGMSMLHGYIKVLDDIKNFNMDDVKQEVSDFVPATTGSGCCG